MPSNIFSKRSPDKSVFTDERFLYPEFVPERLPHREKEIEGLVNCFKPLLSGKRPLTVFLAGPTGVGKTACAKFVLGQLKEASGRTRSLYINCFEYSSRASVLIALANFVGAAVPRRGLATDEVFSEFLQGMAKCSFTPVLILDEADQLLLNEENSKLLYDLLRVVEYGSGPVLGVIMISNDAGLTSRLDSRIRSSLAQHSVQFEPYTPSQLKAILSERAELSFAKGCIEKDVVGVAAAHAAKHGGDCRVAIESLLKAGRIADRKSLGKVTVENLKEAFESVDSVSALKGVKHLSKDELAVLKIIAGNQPVNSGAVYGFYSASGGALKERSLRAILSSLEKKGIVSGREISLGNMGKTREFLCVAPAASVLSEISAVKN